MSIQLLLQFCIGLTGCIIYFFLMLMQFPDHDYYFIDTFYPMLMLLVIFLASIPLKSKLLDGFFWIAIAFLIYQSIGEAKDALNHRYASNSWDRVEITHQNYIGSERFLDSVGVPKTAKVLVIDGYTTNVPLILMHRMGWTVNWTSEYWIREGLSKPFDIVAIQNSFIASDVVRNYPGIISQLKKFADSGFVSFYKKEKTQQSTDQFFGIDSTSVIYRTTFESKSVDSTSEYFNIIQDSSSRFISGKPTKILISGEIQCGPGKPRLISSIDDGDSTYYYFLFNLEEYIQKNTWQPLLFQFVLPAGNSHSGIVKTYLWNAKKVPYALRNMEVVVYH